MTKTLGELAEKVSASLIGDASCEISGIAPIHTATHGQLTFLHQQKYSKFLETTKASAIIVTEAFAARTSINRLVVKDPYFAYAVLAREFERLDEPLPTGIHPTAIIGKNCRIHERACIGAYVVLGDDVVISAETQIYPSCVVGDRTTVGTNCILMARVTLYRDTVIGNRAILHSGCVIGADGFGFANHEGRWNKIPQLGRVVIGSDVEIGANTTIDRGALEDTIIGDGVKLDNQIQIGHNVQIGDHTAVAGCAGIAGSTKIGKYCMIGAGAGITGHVELADRVIIGGMATVSKSIKEPDIYMSGTGHMPIKEWQKSVIRFRHLDELARRLFAVEDKIKELTKGKE